MITAIKTPAIICMSTTSARKIRQTLQDDYGNRLAAQAAQVDDGGAPCRHCLRIAYAGEEVILFSYKPFERTGLYQEVGPVFVHAHECPAYPSDGGFPPFFKERPLILRPYDAHDAICASQVYANPGEAEATVSRLLEDPTVAYVHARGVPRGCYMLRVERARQELSGA